MSNGEVPGLWDTKEGSSPASMVSKWPKDRVVGPLGHNSIGGNSSEVVETTVIRERMRIYSLTKRIPMV